MRSLFFSLLCVYCEWEREHEYNVNDCEYITIYVVACKLFIQFGLCIYFYLFANLWDARTNYYSLNVCSSMRLLFFSFLGNCLLFHSLRLAFVFVCVWIEIYAPRALPRFSISTAYCLSHLRSISTMFCFQRENGTVQWNRWRSTYLFQWISLFRYFISICNWWW